MRQLNGDDYQAAAIDIATRCGFDLESDEYTQLQTSPDPACDCNTCRMFSWE
jgi:hypothetical protein